jgi:predicted aconitase with swiveling domain
MDVATTKEAIMFKKALVILACGVLVAPVAFSQPRPTQNKQTAADTEQGVTVTGTIIKMTTGEGSAASYQPLKTLVVREDRSNTPGSYVLNGPGHVVNKSGQVIQTAIKPGTHVRVFYVNTGDSRIVDHVVVD